LLQATCYIIEDVNDGTPKVHGDVGCEGINMDTEEADMVTPQQQKEVESEINSLSYNQQLDLNLRYWSAYTPNLTERERMTKKYLRYRVEFPKEEASMQTFTAIEDYRPILFNLACVHKLADQNALQNYLIREKHSSRLEDIYHQLTALKILFGALTGTKDRAMVAHMNPPVILHAKSIEEEMHTILHEIRHTDIVRRAGVRLRNNALKQALSKPSMYTTSKLVKPLMGLVNQVTKNLLGCTYKITERTQSKVHRVCTWKLTTDFIDDVSVIDIATRSLLCTDLNTPGHPFIPTPMM
jgi:hypothetical protein